MYCSAFANVNKSETCLAMGGLQVDILDYFADITSFNLHSTMKWSLHINQHVKMPLIYNTKMQPMNMQNTNTVFIGNILVYVPKHQFYPNNLISRILKF